MLVHVTPRIGMNCMAKHTCICESAVVLTVNEENCTPEFAA